MNCINIKLFNQKNNKKLALTADYVWLNGNEKQNGIPVMFTNRNFCTFLEIPHLQNKSLYSSNVFEGINDKLLKDTFTFFKLMQTHLDR